MNEAMMDEITRKAKRPKLTPWQENWLAGLPVPSFEKKDRGLTLNDQHLGYRSGRTFACVFYALSVGESGEMCTIVAHSPDGTKRLVATMPGFSDEARDRVRVIAASIHEGAKKGKVLR